MARRSLLAVALTFISLSVYAQGRQPGLAPNAFTTETIEPLVFRAVEDDHGGFYLAWASMLSSGHLSIVADHLLPDGSLGWAAHSPLVQDLNAVDTWDAFSDGQGGLILSWYDGT